MTKTAPELALSESAWQSRVIGLARLYGWLCVHMRPARTAKGWRTPYEGDLGLPDLILARGGRVLLVELKTDTGRTTAQQDAWLTALGECGRLWRPRDWACVVEELA